MGLAVKVKLVMTQTQDTRISKIKYGLLRGLLDLLHLSLPSWLGFESWTMQWTKRGAVCSVSTSRINLTSEPSRYMVS